MLRTSCYGVILWELPEQSGIQAAQLRPLSANLAELLYWLVFILFLPAVLGALALEGLLEPVQGMIAEIFSFLPNLFAALLISTVGWFVARIVQKLVSNLLAVQDLNKLGERAGLSADEGARQFSDLVGLVVYILILLPVVISALAALELEAITRPATDMLATILGALPGMFAATVVLTLAYLVGRLLSNWWRRCWRPPARLDSDSHRTYTGSSEGRAYTGTHRRKAHSGCANARGSG